MMQIFLAKLHFFMLIYDFFVLLQFIKSLLCLIDYQIENK